MKLFLVSCYEGLEMRNVGKSPTEVTPSVSSVQSCSLGRAEHQQEEEEEVGGRKVKALAAEQTAERGMEDYSSILLLLMGD